MDSRSTKGPPGDVTKAGPKSYTISPVRPEDSQDPRNVNADKIYRVCRTPGLEWRVFWRKKKLRESLAQGAQGHHATPPPYANLGRSPQTPRPQTPHFMSPQQHASHIRAPPPYGPPLNQPTLNPTFQAATIPFVCPSPQIQPINTGSTAAGDRVRMTSRQGKRLVSKPSGAAGDCMYPSGRKNLSTKKSRSSPPPSRKESNFCDCFLERSCHTFHDEEEDRTPPSVPRRTTSKRKHEDIAKGETGLANTSSRTGLANTTSKISTPSITSVGRTSTTCTPRFPSSEWCEMPCYQRCGIPSTERYKIPSTERYTIPYIGRYWWLWSREQAKLVIVLLAVATVLVGLIYYLTLDKCYRILRKRYTVY